MSHTRTYPIEQADRGSARASLAEALGFLCTSEGVEQPFLCEERWLPHEKTSWHESGHATAAVVLPNAHPVSVVTRLPTTDANGSTWRRPDGTMDQFSPQCLFAEAVVSCSGPLAERIACGETYGWGDDVDMIELRLNWIIREPNVALIKKVKRRALEVLHNHWDAVRAVAAALLEKQQLSGSEVEQIVRAHPTALDRETAKLASVIADEFRKLMPKQARRETAL